MKVTNRTLLALALALLPTFAMAHTAVVEAVQYPAWLERGGHAVPLTPGTVLQPRDQLRTGTNARVQMKLGEGSAVKLGENAQFVLEKAEDRSIFTAALRVVTGAFRFTTGALSTTRKRDVSIRVKNVTAGVRGTDLWGKSGDDRDIVCLLEGKITVGAEGHPTVSLDKPLDFYQKPRDGKPEVARVDQKQVDEWARETEISKDGPSGGVGGKWSVVAATFGRRDEALALSRALRKSGYPSTVASEGAAFVVLVPGLSGEPQARALMGNLREVKGVDIPSVREAK